MKQSPKGLARSMRWAWAMMSILVGVSGCARRGHSFALVDVVAEEARFAVVGPSSTLAGPPKGLEQSLDEDDLQFVIFMGDQVVRSTWRNWAKWEERFASILRHPHVLLPGPGERRNDPRLRHFEGFPAFVDIRAGQQTWRLLFLVAQIDHEPTWLEQQFDIPRFTRGEFDHLLVFVADPPDHRGTANLLHLVHTNTDLVKLCALVTGGPRSVSFPSGEFGEVELQVGPAGTDDGSWWMVELRQSLLISEMNGKSPLQLNYERLSGWTVDQIHR
jgi:hypothetical protein